MMTGLLPISLLGGLLGLDTVSLPQAMLSRPLVAKPGVLQADQAERAEQLVDQPDPWVPDPAPEQRRDQVRHDGRKDDQRPEDVAVDVVSNPEDKLGGQER